MTYCAAILAGGLGTRLRSVVHDRPKVMAMVAGRPFITYLLDELAEASITRVVLCTGYLANILSDELGVEYRGMELLYSEEPSPLGTGGALRHASELFSGDTLLVLNGDSYCQCRLDKFMAGFALNGAPAGMVLAQVDDVSRFGAVLIRGDSRIGSFVEKGGQSGPGWINAGIYLLPLQRIRHMTPGRQISLEREIFPALIAEGLYGYQTDGPFIDIGIPAEYQRAQSFFSAVAKG